MMVDWSSLPAGLAVLVAQRLTVYADHLHFGAACTAWRSAARARDGRPRTFHPYLLKDTFSDTVALHSPSGGEILHAPIPESEVNFFRCIASSQGWLLLTDTSARVFLFDPLSNSRVDLPCRTYSPNPDIAVSHHRKFRKVLWQGCVASDGTRAVMVSYYDNVSYLSSRYKLEYARPGDEEWTPIMDRRVRFDSICHHEGKFYVVDRAGQVLAIEITTDSSTSAAAAVTRTYSVATGIMDPYMEYYTTCGRKFIVFTACGEMLLFHSPWFPNSEPLHFATFELDGTVWKRVHHERLLRDLLVFACRDCDGSIFSTSCRITSDYVALYTFTDNQWRLQPSARARARARARDGDDGAPAPLTVGMARPPWVWFAPTYK